MTRRRKGARRVSSPPRLQDTVRLSAEGLAKVLGDLEARVMRAVWRLNRPAPARTVHEAVVQDHEVALLTVITVLNKLTAKGLLTREKRDDLLHYSASLGEEEFRAVASRRIVSGILSLAPGAVAASLVDALAVHDPKQLAELRRLVNRKLRERGNG